MYMYARVHLRKPLHPKNISSRVKCYIIYQMSKNIFFKA